MLLLKFPLKETRLSKGQGGATGRLFCFVNQRPQSRQKKSYYFHFPRFAIFFASWPLRFSLGYVLWYRIYTFYILDGSYVAHGGVRGAGLCPFPPFDSFLFALSVPSWSSFFFLSSSNLSNVFIHRRVFRPALSPCSCFPHLHCFLRRPSILPPLACLIFSIPYIF